MKGMTRLLGKGGIHLMGFKGPISFMEEKIQCSGSLVSSQKNANSKAEVVTRQRITAQ